MASYCDEHIRRGESWRYLNAFVSPLRLVVALSFAGFMIAGVKRVFGYPPCVVHRDALLLTFGSLWALAAETILKTAFGRSGTPAYLQDRAYEFHFFAGGGQFDSFPSGTALVSFTIASLLSSTQSRYRYLGFIVATSFSFTVILTNGHWVSDVIAGAFLGWLMGQITFSFAYEQMKL